jgi:hypothetical protein
MSQDFNGDVATVKERKAAAAAEHNAKLASIRAALDGDAAAARAATEAAAAKAETERAAAATARQQADEQRERSLALVAWKAAGGTDESFEQQWPELRRRQILERLHTHERAARAAQAALYKSIF